jgi:hypothetical protein
MDRGNQVDMDVSGGRIRRIWMPAIHAGMTKLMAKSCLTWRFFFILGGRA